MKKKVFFTRLISLSNLEIVHCCKKIMFFLILCLSSTHSFTMEKAHATLGTEKDRAELEKLTDLDYLLIKNSCGNSVEVRSAAKTVIIKNYDAVLLPRVSAVLVQEIKPWYKKSPFKAKKFPKLEKFKTKWLHLAIERHSSGELELRQNRKFNDEY